MWDICLLVSLPMSRTNLVQNYSVEFHSEEATFRLKRNVFNKRCPPPPKKTTTNKQQQQQQQQHNNITHIKKHKTRPDKTQEGTGKKWGGRAIISWLFARLEEWKSLGRWVSLLLLQICSQKFNLDAQFRLGLWDRKLLLTIVQPAQWSNL